MAHISDEIKNKIKKIQNDLYHAGHDTWHIKDTFRGSNLAVGNVDPSEKLTIGGSVSAIDGDVWADNISLKNLYTIVSTNSSTWDTAYSNVNANSADWESVYSTVYVNSASWANHTIISELTGDWESVYSTVYVNSANWNNTHTTVSTNSSNWQSTYTNVNVNSSDWESNYTTTNTNSANWNSVYTNVYENSASWANHTIISGLTGEWDSAYTSLNALSSKWNSNYTTTNSNSANWNTTYSNVNANSADWESSYTSLNSLSSKWNSNFTTTNSNSANWNSVYSNVNVNSSDWESTFTTVNTNSASWANHTNINGLTSEWDSAYTSLNSLSSKWNSNYTTTNTNSANWNSVYSNVNANSGEWESSYTSLNSLSSKWNSNFTTTNTNSANWNTTYSNVNVNSADWESTFSNVRDNSASWNNHTIISGLTGEWDSAYTTVNVNSANWNNHTDISGLTGDWQNSYTSLNSLSSKWESNYTTTNTNSANWNTTYTNVNVNSSDWESTFSNVRDNSASWASHTSVSELTGEWDSAYTSLNALSSKWNSNYTTTNTNSANWNSVYSNVNVNSADWDSAYTSLNALSSKWNSNYTTTNTNSANWSSVYSNVLANSADWESSYTSLNALSSKWNSNYTTTNTNSANWSSVYSNVLANSADWEGSVDGSGTVTYIPKWSSTTDLSDSLMYDTGSSIFIDSGSYKVLHIVSNNTYGASIVFSDTSAVSTEQNWYARSYNGLFGIGRSSAGYSYAAHNIQIDAAASVVTLYPSVQINGMLNSTNRILSNKDVVAVNTYSLSAIGSSMINVATTSANWNSAYTNVLANSADWESSYTTTNTNSAKWNSGFTTTNTNSANWNSAYSTLNANSADWESSIDGSGTANYIPKWSGTTDLSNSVMYEAGGNIGIGTTTPSAALHVYGADVKVSGLTYPDYLYTVEKSLSAAPQFVYNSRRSFNGGSSNQILNIYYSGSGGGHSDLGTYLITLGLRYSTEVFIFSLQSEYYNIHRYGIRQIFNHTAPSISRQTLPILITNTSTIFELELQLTGGSDDWHYASVMRMDPGANTGITFTADITGKSGTDVMPEDVLGYYGGRTQHTGIGTTNPAAMLDVWYDTSNNSNIRLNRQSTSSSGSIIYRTNSVNKWELGPLNDATDNFHLYGGAIAANVIDITSSTGLTTINKNLKVKSDIQAIPNGATSGTFKALNASSVKYFETTTSSSNGILSLFDSLCNTDVYLNTSGASYFKGGNVGIGTASPLRTLEVNGQLTVGNSTDGVTLGLNGTVGTVYGLNNASGYNDLELRTGASPIGIMIKATSGNVGIGTTSPLVKLHVSNDIYAGFTSSILHYYDNSYYAGTYNDGNNRLFYIDNKAASTGAQGAIHMRTGSTLTTGFTLDRLQNVGIGTTSPSYKLDVSGTVNATGATTLGSTLTVTGAITSGGNTVLTTASTLNSLSGVTVVPIAGDFLKYNGTTWTEGVITEADISDLTAALFEDAGGDDIRPTSAATDVWIVRDTSDGSDTKRIGMASGSTLSNSRGGYMYAAGNENVSGAGWVGLVSGAVAGGRVYVNSYEGLSIQRTSGKPSIKAYSDGYLIMDSTGGYASVNHYVADNIALAVGGGSVGIGGTAPTAQSRLDIFGLATNTTALINLSNGSTTTTPTGAQIAFAYSGAATYRHNIRSVHSGGGAGGNSLRFYLWHYGVNTTTDLGTREILTLLGNGAVGINTVTPTYGLDVTGTMRATGATTLDSTLTVTGIITATTDNHVLHNWRLEHAGFGNPFAAITNKALTQSNGNYALMQSSAGYTYVNAASGASVFTRVNNTTVSQVTSTGVAVTGVLSTTGDLTVSSTYGFAIGGVSGNARIQHSGGVFTLLTSGNTVASIEAASISSSGTGNGGQVAKIINPEGGSLLSTGATYTGAIKITLPVSWTNSMLSFKVRVYEYTTGESFEIHLGGYNHTSGVWYNETAYIVGGNTTGRNFTARFGHDGTKCCVYIGETGSQWAYPQILVTDVMVGFGNYAASTWRSGWAVAIVGTLGTITRTVTNTQLNAYVNGNAVLTTADLLDEDTFSSNSATKAPSQQSTKAYVDSQTSAVTGQWATSGSDIYRASGKVGIGTASPSVTFTVQVDQADDDYPIADFFNTNSAGGTRVKISGDGATSDAVLQFVTDVDGTPQNWAMGIDGSDSDKFKIGSHYLLGSDNALTIDTSGNVGIGTTSPARELDIIIPDDTGSRGLIIQNSDGHIKLQNATGTANNFAPNYSTLIRGSTQSTLFDATIGSSDDTGTGAMMVFRAYRTTPAVISSRNLFEWRNYATSVMSIAASGNVGIGTASPTNPSGFSQATTLEIDGNGTHGGALKLSNSAGNTFAIATASLGLYFRNDTNSTTPMLISNSGKVGIGRAPLYSFDIHTAMDATYPNTIGILNVSSSTAFAAGIGGNISFGGIYTGSTTTAWALIGGYKENATDGNFAGYLGFFTRAHGGLSTEKLRITSSGNVGIGMTNPSFDLDVIDNIGIRGASTNTTYTNAGQLAIKRSNSAPFVTFHSDTGTRQAYIQSNSTTFGFVNEGSTSMFFSNGGSTRMTILNGGNVGIGTTSPSYLLHVSDTSNNTTQKFHVGTGTYGLSIGNSTGTGYSPRVIGYPEDSSDLTQFISAIETADDTGSTAIMQFDARRTGGVAVTRPLFDWATYGTSKMTIAASGNLGIGTTAPAQLLTLNATANPFQQFSVSDVAKAYLGSITTTNGLIGGSVNGDFGFRTQGGKMLWSTNSGTTAHMVLNGSGNVGIGTASPASKLDVSGRIMQTGSAAITGYLNSNSGLLASTSSLNPGLLLFGTVAGSAGNYYGMDLGYSNAKFRTRIFTPTTGDISFASHVAGTAPTVQSSFTDLMTINGSTGYVGIGTQAPSYKLDVNGNSRVTGTLSVTSNISGATITSTGAVNGATIASTGEVTGDAFIAGTSNLNMYYKSTSQTVSGSTTSEWEISSTYANDTAYASAPAIVQAGNYGFTFAKAGVYEVEYRLNILGMTVSGAATVTSKLILDGADNDNIYSKSTSKVHAVYNEYNVLHGRCFVSVSVSSTLYLQVVTGTCAVRIESAGSYILCRKV